MSVFQNVACSIKAAHNSNNNFGHIIKNIENIKTLSIAKVEIEKMLLRGNLKNKK